MQLSELLGAAVHDHENQVVGTCTDVRLVVTGDIDERPDPPRLFGLIVSPHTASSYWGYERSDATRPAPLAALLRWRHRGTFLVLWEDLAGMDNRCLRLREGFTCYSPVLREDD